MNNYTNIYDIDGNIIRKAGDNHKFTIEEIEKLVDDLTKKVQDNPDNEVYKVYLNNAQGWLYNMYNNMSAEELKKRLSSLEEVMQNAVDNAKSNEAETEQKNLDDLNKAMDEFAEQYKSDTPEILEDVRPETVMDEYVEPIEEIK